MLRLFSSIRKSMFQKGKLSRYFGYAFGEIVLIVVGILIALQINNYSNKFGKMEKEKQIQTKIHKIIEAYEFDSVLDHLNQNNSDTDSQEIGHSYFIIIFSSIDLYECLFILEQRVLNIDQKDCDPEIHKYPFICLKISSILFRLPGNMIELSTHFVLVKNFLEFFFHICFILVEPYELIQSIIYLIRIFQLT